MGGACRCQVAQVGNLLADLVEQIQVKVNTRLVGDGQQVKHAVGGTAQGHIAGQCVPQRRLVDDLTSRDATLQHVHNGHSGVLGQNGSLIGYGRNGAVAGQGNTYGLAQAVHGVGGVHTGARTATGANARLAFLQLATVDQACLVRSHCLKHLGQGNLLAVITTCQHRAARADHGGDVHTDSGHDHTGNDLVTVGDQHHAVKAVSHHHGLHAVSDQLAGGQRIFHTDVTHGNSVAHANGGDQNGRTASHADACLNGIGDFV